MFYKTGREQTTKAHTGSSARLCLVPLTSDQQRKSPVVIKYLGCNSLLWTENFDVLL
jgi:hypothetical protein